MKIKGFTLIELLVVVAIIGILAAVGVVAYSGYISGAKKSSLTNRHAVSVKFLMSEILKCDAGEKFILNNSQTFDQCSRVLNPTSTKTKNLSKSIINHFNNVNEWKNIYDISLPGAKEGSKKNCEKGYICVGGYIAGRLTITVNYDDVQSNFISKIILLDN